MIRWFKRKKKKDKGEVQKDIRETDIELEEDLQDEEVPFEESGAPGSEAAEEPEPETLVPEAAEEEETREEEEAWAGRRRYMGGRRGSSGRPRSGGRCSEKGFFQAPAPAAQRNAAEIRSPDRSAGSGQKGHR